MAGAVVGLMRNVCVCIRNIQFILHPADVPLAVVTGAALWDAGAAGALLGAGPDDPLFTAGI